MRILVDLDLVLDVLLDREPHADAAAALWSSVETGESYQIGSKDPTYRASFHQ